MSSLVLELQHRALDPTMSTPDLVRTAFAVASKLGVEDLERWTRAELRGYGPGEDVPTYRQLSGRLMAFNPFRGWIPVMLDDRAMEVATRTSYVRSLDELVALLNSDHPMYQVPFPTDVQRLLIEQTGEQMVFALHLSRPSLQAILAAVRDVVLEWALSLEKRGVLGEGLTFTERERQAAHTTNISIGTMTSSQLMHDSPQGNQQLRIQREPLDLAGLRRLVADIRRERGDLELADGPGAELTAELATLDAQLASPAPKPQIVRASLDAIRRVLEGAAAGAAGNLLTEVLRFLG